MKKIKLIALSLLTFSAAGILASCAGGNQPQGKEDVYFHATSRVITSDGTQSLQFADEECATVEVKDKDSLKYGKQDVVITIRPKQFFTFREYDLVTWAPKEGSTPIKPFVGLGNPISLYNYPLQEDVAWTFEDKSTESTTTGFLHEEYVITVKKEFFQKNIVIDYGNVKALNNAIYAYTSSIYSAAFNDVSSLDKSFGCGGSEGSNFYKLDKNYSAFPAASKGATVTYTFAHQDSPFNFNGWDNADVPVSSANDSTKFKYSHFEVNGIDKDGKKTELAIYDKSLGSDKQSFDPVVTKEGKYISFFIKWDLLANNDSDYSTKFENIEVILKEPSCDYTCQLAFDSLGITSFKGDFFQYPSAAANDKKPIVDDRVFETYNETTKTAYKFTNVLDIENLGESHVQYGTAFQLPEGNDGKLFSIYLDGNEDSPLFNIDLINNTCTPATQTTNWRAPASENSIGDSLKETELKYWVNNGWHLVQLNPTNPTKRTFGFFDASGQPVDTFNGKENLYYLYTTNLNALALGGNKSSILHVKLNEPPVQVTFTLADDGTTRDFGSFSDSNPAIYDTSRSVGDGDVAILFYPNNDYINSEFNVALSSTEFFTHASYEKDPSSAFGIIKLFRNAESIPQGSTVTITLTQPDTYVTLIGQTLELGGFVDAEGNPYGNTHGLINDEKELIDQNKLVFRFHLGDGYANRIIVTEGEEVSISNDLAKVVTYRGNPLDVNQVQVIPDSALTDTIQIIVSLSGAPATQGEKIEISLSFMSIEATSETLSFGCTIESIKPLGEYVGTTDEITITLTFTSSVPEKLEFNCKSTRGGFDVEGNPLPSGVYKVVLNFKTGDFPTIQNGIHITIFVSEAKA